MPLITICPRCTSHLGLSEDVTPAAQVQCPICEVEFSLATVVPRELPQARLIDHVDVIAPAETPATRPTADESVQDKLSALLRSTSQWRPTPPADEAPARDDGEEPGDDFVESGAGATDQQAPASLKLGDSRLDQLLSDLMKDSGSSSPLASPSLASQPPLPERGADEFTPSSPYEFHADVDDDSPAEAYAHADETDQHDAEQPLVADDSQALPADLPTSPRRRRKPRVVRTLVGVVAGGFLGVALGAYGLLWIKGREGDLLGIAPYLPPAMLPPSVTQVADDTAANSNPSSHADRDQPQAESVLADASTEPPRYDPAVAPASVEEPVEDPQDESAAARGLTLAPDSAPPTLAAEQPPELTQPPATEWVKNLRGVPLHTLAELDQSLKPADAALNQFLAGDLAQQESWATMGPAYITLAALAEQFTLLDPAEENASSTSVESAKDLFRRLVSDGARRTDLATVAARWLQHERRQNQGVVLVGKISGASATGYPVYSVDVPLGESKVSANVLMAANIDASSVSLQPGDDIAVVGAILTNPAEQLPGYENPGAPLIIAGWAFTPLPTVRADASTSPPQ